MTKIDSGSQPPLSRRTSSSIITMTPAPMSVAIAKIPPATSGHITSITLMPVSKNFGSPAVPPARKCGWIGEAWECGPRGQKAFLDHVLGQLELMDQRQRRAEGKVLEPLRKLHEGSYVTAACQTHQTFVIHDGILAPKGARKRVRPLGDAPVTASTANGRRGSYAG
jgi:hypothetical protein